MPASDPPAFSSPRAGDTVDALVLCALQDELEGVLELGENGRAGWEEQRDREGFRLYGRTIENGRGGRLRLAAAWAGQMGPVAAATRAQQLVRELDPACLAMCGICAGDRGKVALGDVIVADQLYRYDEGKVVAGQGMSYSLRTFDLEATWKMDAAFLARELPLASLAEARPRSRASQQRWLLAALLAQVETGGAPPASHPERKARCPNWADVVREAQRAGLVVLKAGNLSLTDEGRGRAQEENVLFIDGLPEDPPFQIHVGAIATGSAVQEDPALFDRLRRLVRTTLGVEMEGAAIGDVAARFARRALVVKAVSDHADHEKDDTFRAFACRASAEVLLAFLRRHLEPGEKPKPRVLVAGPWYGVPAELRRELENLWIEERSSNKTLARIRSRLRHVEVRRAHIAASLRYDVILDLSPWRAFSDRWSLGLRDVEREPARDGPRVPLLYLAAPEGELPEPNNKPPARLVARLEALQSQVPELAQRIFEASGAGIAVAGFSPGTWSWWQPLLSVSPAQFIGDVSLGAVPPDRFVAAPELVDTCLREPTLDDYLHALRITAGQVTLAGERAPRPIREVYVDLEIQREEERRKDSYKPRDDRPDQDRASSEALRDELEARRKAAWDTPGTDVLPASALHEVARRLLLWGPAGTGKSTLLRYLACKVADEERIPLWLPSIVDLGDQPADTLARRALDAVGLPDGPSPAFAALRQAVQEGRAFLFLDGFDEAPPAVRHALPKQVRDLHAEIRVVLASRPLHRTHTGLKEITLTGLPVTGAEEMLRAYFKSADWIEPLLHDLDLLPDGMGWLRNPVLLGLAASLYQQKRSLPDASLEVYEQVIHHLLKPLAWGVDEVLPALQTQARRMLLPDKGDPHVMVREGELPYRHRDALLASGLLTGDEWLRFTHLSLGEYLAARAEGVDLAGERQREKNRPEGKAEDENALDVLAMAHALRGGDVLSDAFAEAKTDSPGHRMLRLVLRAVGYGGEGARAFCERQGVELLAMLAARIQAPSGRFGDFERLLMGDAERALLVLRPHVKGEVAKAVEERFAPVLATRGEAGTEAHVALWNLGIRKPERRESKWWPTIERQARAMVRAGLGVDDIFEMTEGADHAARHDAIEVLAPYYQDYWQELWPLFDDREMWVRQATCAFLGKVPAAEPYLRERIHDDEGIVRNVAAHALVEEAGRLEANFDRVLALIDDPDGFMQRGTIHALSQDPRARARIREFFRRYVAWSMHMARDAAAGALADDPESEPLIRQFLEDPKTYHSQAFTHLATSPRWHPLLRKRLERPEPEPDVVEALGQDPESKPRIRELLAHPSEYVRSAAVKALRDDEQSRDRIVELLRDPHPHVRDASAEALGDDPTMLPHMARILEEDPEHGSQSYAIYALAKHPAHTRDRLWKYFDETRGKPEHGIISYGWLRAAIVKDLGNDAESRQRVEAALSDPHAEVRKAAIEALADSAREKIRDRLTDEDDRVCQAALLALRDDRLLHDGVRRDLRSNNQIACIVGLCLLVRHRESCERLWGILSHGPEKRRSLTIEPLAGALDSRTQLLEFLGDKNFWVRRAAALVLRRLPETKRRLRAVLERLPSNTFYPVVGHSLDYILELLAEDPDVHPSALALARTAKDHNLVAALIPVLAHYPEAGQFLREQLGGPEVYSNVRAAAIEALAGEKDLREVFVASLEDDEGDVRAAAVRALAEDAEAPLKGKLRQMLSTDPKPEVRRAALDALANDEESRSAIRGRIDLDEDAEVRTKMIGLLTGDPEALPRLRRRLSDRSSDVRIAAVSALRIAPVAEGVPLDQLPSLRIALHFGGHPLPPSEAKLPSALSDRLEAFLRAPRPLNLDRDPLFADVLLGYLCTRLCWASMDGKYPKGRVFGEVKHAPDSLLQQNKPFVIRVAMDSSELPRERFLHPSHNLVEAWNVATHLSAEDPPAFFLACADVEFEHLTPPDLAPGEVCWGPGLFGFRLRQARVETVDPLEWIVSSEAREIWLEADEPSRARYLETLTRLANAPSLDPWSVLPILSRVGDLLPISIRADFSQRLPQSMSEGTAYVERAARSLGAATLATPPAGAASPAAPSPPRAGTQLQEALQQVRATLQGDGPVDPAISAFETTAPFLVSDEIAPADRDEAVMLLAGLRNRLKTVDEARRVFDVVNSIDNTKLSRAARRGLRDFVIWLRTWRIA